MMRRLAALVVVVALALAGAQPLHCASAYAGSGGSGDPHVAAHGHAHHGEAPESAGLGGQHEEGSSEDDQPLPCSALAPCSATAVMAMGPEPGVQRLAIGPELVARHSPPAVHDLSTEPPPPRPAVATT